MEIKTMYRLLIATVFVLLMSIGIYIGIDISGKKEEDKENVAVSNTENIKVYDEAAVSSEIEEPTEVDVKFTDIYPDCGHSIDQEEHFSNTTKEKVKEEIEGKDSTYKLVGEQDGILLYEKVHDGKCLNHYMVVLENDVVKIFRIDEKGDYKPYQDTEITRSMLRDGIAEQLEEGILVDDVEELFLLMEDIES